MDPNCIFCKIINSDTPSEIIYQDDKCIAINDIYPQAPTHILVIPKKHIPTVADVNEEDEHLLGHLIVTAKKLATEKNLNSYKLLFNVGKNAGQTVFHIHLHIMGR